MEIEGLSPRLRGNLSARVGQGHQFRSIPAPAGEPSSASASSTPARVYPRACGGTRWSGLTNSRPRGLSPRLRGNHGCGISTSCRSGSIPAPAGEPAMSSAAVSMHWVYPRACGGTERRAVRNVLDEGLSPRLRGNRVGASCARVGVGSIPAPVGEPGSGASHRTWPRVYPRACGGTFVASIAAAFRQGLSPRLRGNRSAFRRPRPIPGSIPAPAGEPAPCLKRWRHSRVYPRACGGTGARYALLALVQGLSPRLRGNLSVERLHAVRCGSIPAPAGEPFSSSALCALSGVYPRACGGTVVVELVILRDAGLSPRLRGNRIRRSESSVFEGSIPAPAGEP